MAVQENGEMGATRLGSCQVWEEGTAVGSVGRLFVMSKEGVRKALEGQDEWKSWLDQGEGEDVF